MYRCRLFPITHTLLLISHQVRRLLEQEQFREAVQIRKRKDHFIFTIESTGILAPEELFMQALNILQEKAQRLAGRL